MMKHILLILFVSVLITSYKSADAPNVSKPNIVLIMADDLGYGGVSCYGNTTISTPNIDALAADGIRFTDFHSNGAVCSPTRAALMTGKYQQRTGVTGVITAKGHRDVGLSLDEITIAEEFKKYGYNTAIFGKWHLGYPKEYNPSYQGFDEFIGFVSGNVDYHAHIDLEGYLDWWQGTEIINEEGYTTDLISDHAVDYIQKNNTNKTGKPFFLYIPHESPHAPFQKRIDTAIRKVGTPGNIRKDIKGSIPAIYKEMVEVMDEGIGNVIQMLKETGQYDNTVIVFLSDNGAAKYGHNGILRGYKGGAYEGGSRVPAIITYPNKIEKGIENNEVVLTMDLLPTLLDFIGQKPSADNIDGISIKENLLNQSQLPKRDVFFAFKNRSFVRSGHWKLIRIKGKTGVKLELYNLSNDLQEKKDLSSSHPEMANKLLKKIELWEKEVSTGVNMVSN